MRVSLSAARSRAMVPGDLEVPGAAPTYTEARGTDDRMDLKEIAKILRRRRAAVLWTVGVGTAAAVLLTQILTPQYTGVAMVRIDREETRLVETEAVLEEQVQDKTMIETQIKLIESRVFADRVMERLGLFADPEFNPALKPAGPTGIARYVPAVAGWLPERWSQWLPEAWLVATGLAEQPAPASPPLSEPEPEMRPDDIERTIENFRSNLSARQSGNSYIISAEFNSSDPEKAARIANEVAAFYVDYLLELKQAAAERATDWLNRRLAELRRQLLDAEKAIANYREDHELIDGQGVSLTAQELAALRKELILARAEREEKEANLALLQALRESSEELDSVPEVMSSPVIGDLRRQQTELFRTEAQLRQEYGPRHPQIIQLEAEQARIQDNIRAEVQTIIDTLANEVSLAKRREQLLEESIAQGKARLATDREAQVQLDELQREADATRTLYKAFLDRYKKLSEQHDLIESGATVVSSASVPSTPSFPRPKLIIGAGFTTSLIVGTLLAFMIEGLEGGLRSGRQVEQVLGVQNLGLVPKVTLPKGVTRLHHYLFQKPRSGYAEALRSVQIALRIANPDQPPQTVLVTSALPSEGKTTLALSLAASAAACGQPTVIVDLDLRHPSVRRELGQPRWDPGLAEYIAGHASLEEVTYVEELQPKLHAITIRRMPVNPLDLLASDEMAALLALLRGRYAHIILDAPPLLGMTDTRVAVHLADAVLFAVCWGKTNEEVAQNGIDALVESRARIGGAVLTQVDLRKHAKRAYGDAFESYDKYKQYYID